MKSYPLNNYSLLILRVTLSGIFIIAAINHLVFTDKVVARLEGAAMQEFALSVASAHTLVILSGVFMFIGGIALLIGLATRLSAWGLLLILLPITFTVQVGQGATAGPLFKNVVILGGLLFFALNGCLCHGMDHLPWIKKINSQKLKYKKV